MIDSSRLTEDDDRTIGPFTAVITEYREHAEKAIRRDRTKASLYYIARMMQLEGMNGTDYSQ